MAPLYNAKGQPVKMSFLDLFGPSTSSRSGSVISRQERKKPRNGGSTASTKTSPPSTAATEAPTTTVSDSVEWTRLEELALLGMKAQSMSWKEIDEALPGKGMENIKDKYRVLYADAPANVKPKEGDVKKEEAKQEEEKKDEKKEKAKPDEAKDAKEDKKEKSEDEIFVKANKPWKKSQKGYKAQKGKGKAEETKPEEVEPEEAEEAKAEETKHEDMKVTLKAKANAEERGKGGELKSINGHPIIFVDDDEELDFNELLYLYGLNARYDELKWITVDSKFFDRFGKRVGPEKLKEKLAGIS